MPDHPAAVVGLAELLLDISSSKIAPEAPEPPMFREFHNHSSIIAKEALEQHPPRPGLSKTGTNTSMASSVQTSTSAKDPKMELQNPANDLATSKIPKEPYPQELNRLAARDRAYGLLSSLTKLGTGWDFSEAWFALAKSYELSGQVEKAKEVLWWCVELEDTRPVRHWTSVRM